MIKCPNLQFFCYCSKSICLTSSYELSIERYDSCRQFELKIENVRPLEQKLYGGHLGF
jgi:hypothetical protein